MNWNSVPSVKPFGLIAAWWRKCFFSWPSGWQFRWSFYRRLKSNVQGRTSHIVARQINIFHRFEWRKCVFLEIAHCKCLLSVKVPPSDMYAFINPRDSYFGRKMENRRQVDDSKALVAIPSSLFCSKNCDYQKLIVVINLLSRSAIMTLLWAHQPISDKHLRHSMNWTW